MCHVLVAIQLPALTEARHLRSHDDHLRFDLDG